VQPSISETIAAVTNQPTGTQSLPIDYILAIRPPTILLDQKLPTHSQQVQTSDKTWSGGSRMDVDIYSDNLYDYARSKSTNYNETLTQYPTDIAILTDLPSTPLINDLPMQVDE
jgi:hypothetical protein